MANSCGRHEHVLMKPLVPLEAAAKRLNQFLVDRGLARFKLPERVEILAERTPQTIPR